MNTHRLTLCSVGLAVLASAALAQSGRVGPTKIFTTSRAVVESTAKFQPQINPIMRAGLFVPENPGRNLILAPPEAMNALPVGGIAPYKNTTGKAYFPGITATGWVPADPHIAVGKTHVVQVVNSDIAFFTKTGTKVFQQRMDGASGFFGSVGASSFVFDPKAIYDANTDRYFVVALDKTADDSNLLIAVSDDDNPVGNWFKYKINCKLTVGADTFWLDYPGWGLNKDAVVCSGNMFGLNNGGFGGAQFVVIKKAQLLTGAAAQVTSLVHAGGYSVQMAETRDNALDKIYAISLQNTGQVRMYAITNTAGVPVLNFTSVGIPSYNQVTRNANTIGSVLDPVSDRVFQATFINGKLYTTHVAMTNDNRIGSRWYQISMNNYPVGTPTTDMAGLVTANAGQDAFMPGIAVNNLGDVSLIFTRSSPSVAADVMICSRKSTDAPGVMSTPVQMATSTGSGYGGRWGDYHSVQIDPSDGLTFWGVAKTINGNSWATQIVSWSVSSPIEVADEWDATSVAAFLGNYAGGDVTSVQSVNNVTYNVSSVYIQSLGYAAAVEATFNVTPGPYNNMFVKIKANQVLSVTGMVWVWNWNTNSYEFIKAWPLPNSNTVSLQLFGNLARFVGADGTVKVVFRTNFGLKASKSHVLKADLIQFLTTTPG
ncbi:MAG: hypothetical protein KF784_13840 [Fimbriimonadaceae bacterium]|nr:hypothetical protein [Fimbriimonadaceae bacterium]